MEVKQGRETSYSFVVSLAHRVSDIHTKSEMIHNSSPPGYNFQMYSYHLNPSPKVEAACESTWSKIHLERHSINLYPELADFTDTEWSIKRQSMHNTQI